MKKGPNPKELLGAHKVLVVEPTTNYRSSIKSFFANLRIADVRFVSTVKEAKVALLTLDLGLIVCEWSLKETNGIQFCRELRKDPRYQTTPFLLMSVENLKKDIILASEVGVDGYLLKPFSFEEFRDSVASVLRTQVVPTSFNKSLQEGFDHIRQGEMDEADVLFQKLISEMPSSARAWHGMGLVAEKKGDSAHQLEYLRRAHDLNPEYVEALRDLIECLAVRGPTRDLVTYTTRAHEMSPENPKYTLILAKALLEEEDYLNSEIYFKKTIRLSPKLAQAYKGLGRLYMIQDDYDSAMKNFEKSLDLDEEDVSTLNSLGMTYVKLARYKEGIDKYQAALRIRPLDHRILFNLGFAKEKIGDLESARYFYQQALTINPDFDKAQRRIKALDRGEIEP